MLARAIVARARACVGARFRLHGRDPVTGLDCVGLVAFACGIGLPPGRYALRGGGLGAVETAIGAAGFVRAAPARSGDVLLCAPGARQFHFAVLVEAGFVHADARQRRVVEVPGAPRWRVLGAWRISGRG